MPKSEVPSISNPEIESSSDDDAPEEVSVSTSRKQTASIEKGIRVAEKLRKDQEKEKRRQKNELFREQKQKKLADLSKRKLPQDVLDAVSVASGKKSKLGLVQGSEDDGDNGSDLDNDRLSDSGLEEDEFIPLNGAQGVRVVTTKQLTSKRLTSAQQALKFREERLYNQKAIPRVSYKQRQEKLQKQKASQMA